MGESDRPTTLQLALRVTSTASEAYAANPALRMAVIAAVPFVGAAFDALAGTTGSNIAIDRLRIFLEELSERVASLEEGKRDASVTAEDLIDAAIHAARGAVETGNREKVRMIAAALVGATSMDRPLDLDIESVLASLASLTPADLRSARKLVDHLRPGTFPPPAELGPDGLFFIARLQAAGLLESVAVNAAKPSGRHRVLEEVFPAIEYRFTPTFGRVFALLRAGGEMIGIGDASPVP